MRRAVTLSVAVALAVLLVSGVWGSAAREAEGLPFKPNIVFILADDMRKDDLKYMPKTRAVWGEGHELLECLRLQRALLSQPGHHLEGQYAHNTGVWTNEGSSGGWKAYRKEGNEKDNVATRLDEAGYRTGLFGKYSMDTPAPRVNRRAGIDGCAHGRRPLLQLQDERRWQRTSASARPPQTTKRT